LKRAEGSRRHARASSSRTLSQHSLTLGREFWAAIAGFANWGLQCRWPWTVTATRRLHALERGDRAADRSV